MSETTANAVAAPAIINAGSQPKALVPENFEGVYRLARVLAASRMLPKDISTPEQAMVAILHGLEIGMTPMAAVQSIAIVNNRPTLWGDAVLGLVLSSPACGGVEEKIEGDGMTAVATCTALRRSDSGTMRVVRTFSMRDAEAAGLTGKSGPWQSYPRRMLQMRARAFALRDAFADVLRGMAVREEIEDIEDRPHRAIRSTTALPPLEIEDAAVVTEQRATVAPPASAELLPPNDQAPASASREQSGEAAPPDARAESSANEEAARVSETKRLAQAFREQIQKAESEEALDLAHGQAKDAFEEGAISRGQLEFLEKHVEAKRSDLAPPPVTQGLTTPSDAEPFNPESPAGKALLASAAKMGKLAAGGGKPREPKGDFASNDILRSAWLAAYDAALKAAV